MAANIYLIKHEKALNDPTRSMAEIGNRRIRRQCLGPYWILTGLSRLLTRYIFGCTSKKTLKLKNRVSAFRGQILRLKCQTKKVVVFDELSRPSSGLSKHCIWT